MLIGKNIKRIREAKGLSSKEIALSAGVDISHYSRLENNKSDPSLSTLVKVAGALGVDIAALFTAADTFKDVASADKTLMEKLALIEQLDKKEKAAFFSVLDAFVGKKKLKDALAGVLSNA